MITDIAFDERDQVIICLRPRRLAAFLEDRPTAADLDLVDDAPTVPLAHPVRLRRAGSSPDGDRPHQSVSATHKTRSQPDQGLSKPTDSTNACRWFKAKCHAIDQFVIAGFGGVGPGPAGVR
jgi:hypothetical protein